MKENNQIMEVYDAIKRMQCNEEFTPSLYPCRARGDTSCKRSAYTLCDNMGACFHACAIIQTNMVSSIPRHVQFEADEVLLALQKILGGCNRFTRFYHFNNHGEITRISVYNKVSKKTGLRPVADMLIQNDR